MRPAALIVTLMGLAKGLTAQVSCINCFHQNEAVNPGQVNLITNPSFETNTCAGNFGFFCVTSTSYSCDLTGWTCTGGGPSTYAQLFSEFNSTVPDGAVAAYLGNSFTQCCSGTVDDTTCLVFEGCTVTGIPEGFPMNASDFGGANGVTLAQTVTGLTVGTQYTLDFWTGGESFPEPGVFGLDVGFGTTFLQCLPTPPGAIGTRFVVTFQAVATSHTIKFRNWGHISSIATEVVIDDVRLYPAVGGANADFAVDQDGCGNTVTVTADDPTADVLWDMGDQTTFTTTTVTHTYDGPGTYTISLTATDAQCGGTVTTSQVVTVSDPVPVNAAFVAVQADPCAGLTVTTTNGTTGPDSLVCSWNMGDGTILSGTDVQYTYADPGTYTVTLTATDPICGEQGVFSVPVLVRQVPSALLSADVPNVFSPNSDGTNEVFFPIEDAGDAVALTVWNRFGQVVYESKGNFVPWNGRSRTDPVPEGVYYYELSYSFACASGQVAHKRSGNVQVLRGKH